MDARTIIGVGLMVLIYVFFFQPANRPPTPVATNIVETQSVDAVSQATKTTPLTSKRVDTSSNEKLRSKIYKLENENIRLSVNAFGEIQKAELKNYESSEGNEVEFDIPLGFNSSQLLINDREALWKEGAASETAQVVLVAELDGARIKRSISLLPNTFFLTIKDEIQNAGEKSIRANSVLEIFHPKEKEVQPPGFWKALFSPTAETQNIVYFEDGSMNGKILAEFTTPVESIENVSWAGFSYKYFFLGMIPVDAGVSKFRAERTESGVREVLSLNSKQIAPRESSAYTNSFYIGPKDIPELAKLTPELGNVVEYGDWLGPIARFLLNIMHFFYGIIPNYGVAIILLTILVKTALFPLAYKAAVSMRKLQLVGPKMTEIRKKYKDDKFRQNAEMMALYRSEKVNPMGGCLPILLQMPIFFALYRVFFVSIELRHSPFFGWIQDLASHDPFFVTPILMTALMYFQQVITPMPPADEENEAIMMQRKMLKYMPVFFGAIMLFLPAGLNLYMLTNAATSIIQQLWLNRYLNKKFPLPLASAKQARA